MSDPYHLIDDFERFRKEELEMSKREVAAKLAINYDTIRRWECGLRSPSIATQRELIELAER